MDQSKKRLLAIDLSSRGFGYAVFDGPKKLVDWGIRRVAGDKNVQCVDRIRDLMHWYAPEVLVLENTHTVESRRHPRIRALSNDVARLAERLDIEVVRINWALVRQVCGESGSATKEQIAAHVGEMFPEIKRQAPPKRKPWMSEDERMNLFDAVALGATALKAAEVRRSAAQPQQSI